MENKTCLQCGNEFESKVTPGLEQKYCSRQCRMKAGNLRRFETIKTNIVNEIKGTTILHPGERVTESYNTLQGRDSRAADGIRNITDNHLATIKELYEAKNETVFYKLKVDQLEKENNELKVQVFEYENEEGEENEENDNGWLGQVEKALPTLVKSYRDDPEATMGFIGSSANMLFNSIFKPKINAGSTSS
jgi:hypothetical protein